MVIDNKKLVTTKDIISGSHMTATEDGRVVRWCWVNLQCRGVLLIWIIVGQGPIALAVGAGGGGLDIFFSLIYHFSLLSPSLWETARYRLKYFSKKKKKQYKECTCKVSGRSVIFSAFLDDFLSLLQISDYPHLNRFVVALGSSMLHQTLNCPLLPI